MQEVLNLIEYFQELLAATRREPADDLLSAMINAQDIFPTEADLIANAVMILAAGQGTSRKLLGTGIPLLLPDWEMWRARVRDDCTWIRPLVDEMLRVVTPARYLVRRAADGADLSQSFPGNHHIQRGERIVVFLDAANRDPTKFENSSRFCPQRHPTSQLNFGAGPHRCPGASLALVEAHVALDMLFEFPSVRPKPNSAPLWNPNRDMGGFASYVVELRA
jgi:pimeloyl-[acyl-carrier protein] synthase